MRAMFLRAIAVLGLFAAAGTSAHAQDQGEEARLRDALRRTTVDLRSAQDSQAALQTALDQAQRQRDQLQQQVTVLTAKLAQAPAAAASPAPAAVGPSQSSRHLALRTISAGNGPAWLAHLFDHPAGASASHVPISTRCSRARVMAT